MHHAFNGRNQEDKVQVYNFLKLYNFISNQKSFLLTQPNNNPISFLKKFGFIGNIYDIKTKRPIQSFININSFNEIEKQETSSIQMMKKLEKQIDIEIEKAAKEEEEARIRNNPFLMVP